MKRLIVVVLILFAGRQLLAQEPAEDFRSVVLKKKDGAEIVFSGNSHSITLEIESKEIKSTDRKDLIIIDSKVLQYELFADTALQKRQNIQSNQQEKLLAFMKGQLSYAKHKLKQHYTNSGHDWRVINNTNCLLWYYDLPGEHGSVLKQINLSVVCFSRILTLTVFSNVDDEALLTEIEKTLKLNDFKIDFNARLKSINGK